MATRRAIVVGAGFGGLSAAAYLAQAGYDVTLYEKNEQPGGRAQVLKKDGFTFDLGPSWYMIPDMFEEVLADFGKTPSDYYTLKQLNPAYTVFSKDAVLPVTKAPDIYPIFDEIDPGSAKRLEKYLAMSKWVYESIRPKMLKYDYASWGQLASVDVLKLIKRPDLLLSLQRQIKGVTKNEDLQHILGFMSVFLGGTPKNIPGVYSVLSEADFNQGIFYPMGGFGAVVDGFVRLAKEQGVKIELSSPVDKIVVEDGRATGVVVNGSHKQADIVIANADYQFVDQVLLDAPYRRFSESYWHDRTLSPSGLLIFLGLNKRVPKLTHHSLFLDSDWDGHFDAVYKEKHWVDDPLFYVSVTSKTDPSVAPKGHENMFILVPQTAGTQPSDVVIQRTIDRVIDRLEARVGMSIRDAIVVQEVRAQDYFIETFNAFEGNAFGLAHTLRQSIAFRPPVKSRKVKGLYFAGQYTNPGTGVPLVVLSGKVAAMRAIGDSR